MGDESSVSITAEAWEQALEVESRAFMEETRTAVDAVREGHWIADTEELAREAGERFRRRAFRQFRYPLRGRSIGGSIMRARLKNMRAGPCRTDSASTPPSGFYRS